MILLSVVTIDENEKWDRIVRSFADYDVYYLSGYAKAFQIHGDGEPLLIYYDDDNTRAINVVMKRDVAQDPHFIGKLPENTYFDLATPYGYGGFLLEGSNAESLNREYEGWCRDNGIICEFVRFHPLLENHLAVSDIYELRELSKTVSVELQSQAQIWEIITSKNRNMIRKAQKNGVQVFWGRDQRVFAQFMAMYNATMDKDQAVPYYYFGSDFYRSTLNDFKHNATVFYATVETEVIAMAIILHGNRHMHYHLATSGQNHTGMGAMNLLIYEVATWGAANGYKALHLGGGVGSAEDSLYKFKKSFSRSEDNTFIIGKKCFDDGIYAKLVAWREKEDGFDRDSGYFPLYRA